MGKSAGQVVVSFGADELDLHDAVKKLHERTGIPQAVIVKNALKAALFDDKEAMATFRAMKDFTAAARHVALEVPTVAVG